MRCRNLDGTIIKVTTAATADTLFTVAHELGRVPKGCFTLRSIYPSAVLYRHSTLSGGLGAASNIVGAWEFEGGLGSLGTDSGLNGYTLTEANTPTTGVGKVGNYLGLARSSTEYLTRNSEAGLQCGDIDFTIAAWLYATDNTTWQYAVAKDSAVLGRREYILSNYFGTMYFSCFRATDTYQEKSASSFGVVPLNTWFFCVCWHNAVANTINIQCNNGTVDSLGSTTALQAASDAPFRIGAKGDATLAWNGRIDQVMMWKRILTAAERTALYNGGNGLTYAQVSLPPLLEDYPWDATNAYLKCNVGGAQFYVLFF